MKMLDQIVRRVLNRRKRIHRAILEHFPTSDEWILGAKLRSLSCDSLIYARLAEMEDEGWIERRVRADGRHEFRITTVGIYELK